MAMAQTGSLTYCFAGFSLNPGRGLFRGTEEVPLRAKSFGLLNYLAQNAGRIVTKDELIAVVWEGLAVTDDSLTQSIHDVRRALGDTEQKLIRTVPRRGYLFPIEALDAAVNAKSPLLPEVPSIAVLPFLNLGGDPAQDYFSDGLTEDLITDLSRISGLFVIARNSTFALKGKPVDVRVVAENLGVRYLLEGSTRRAGSRVRINVQLIDAPGGSHVWAERFDSELVDIFAVQDQVTAKIVEALIGRLGAPPLRNRPKNLEAYDLCMRARSLTELSPQAAREATLLLRRAIELDADYAEAHRLLALSLWLGWVHWGEPEASHRGQALAEAEKSVRLDPGDSATHSLLGYILAYERRWEDSEHAFAQAMRLNLNNAEAWAYKSDISALAGKPLEAIDEIHKALRLNPAPDCWYWLLLGQAQYGARQYEAAVATLRREETYRTMSRRFLAASLAKLGRMDEARREAEMFLLTSPHFTISHWAANQPFRDADTRAHFVEGLKLAGLPE
jgi:TolB-like protein